MALPSSGPISLRDVNVELGKSPESKITLNDADVKKLEGDSSDGVDLEDLYGKVDDTHISFVVKMYDESDFNFIIYKLNLHGFVFDGINSIRCRVFARQQRIDNSYMFVFQTSDSIKRKVKISINNDSVECYMNDSSQSDDTSSWQYNIFKLFEKYKSQEVNIKIELIERIEGE